MKYLFIPFILFSLIVRAQTEKVKPEQSKIEQFSSVSGKLIEKNFTFLGTIGSLKMQLLTIRNLIENTKVEGVKFEVEYTAGYSSSVKRTKAAFLDYDEIGGLIKSLEYLKTNVLTVQKEYYTEVFYKSRAGAEFGAYFEEKTKTWKPYLQVDKFDSDSFITIRIQDIDMILTSLTLAKKMIEDPSRK